MTSVSKDYYFFFHILRDSFCAIVLQVILSVTNAKTTQMSGFLAKHEIYSFMLYLIFYSNLPQKVMQNN